jgi:hypothetical protein
MHLIDKHAFPKDYDFYVVNDGIDRRSSMLRSGRHRRKSSAAQQSSIAQRNRQRSSTLDASTKTKDTEDERDESPEGSQALTPGSSQADDDMKGLTGAMSSLKFVPAAVRFGGARGRGRGGFSRS